MLIFVNCTIIDLIRQYTIERLWIYGISKYILPRVRSTQNLIRAVVQGVTRIIREIWSGTFWVRKHLWILCPVILTAGAAAFGLISVYYSVAKSQMEFVEVLYTYIRYLMNLLYLMLPLFLVICHMFKVTRFMLRNYSINRALHGIVCRFLCRSVCTLAIFVIRGYGYRTLIQDFMLDNWSDYSFGTLILLAFFDWTNIDHIKVLLMIIFINYVIGMAKKESKALLLVGIVLNISILVYYKYTGMIVSALQKLFGGTETDPLQILAPVRISFIIFRAISYLMDLYQDHAESCHNFINFALYITFFPKLIQGPIVKYKDMKQQLEERLLTTEKVSYGIERFIIGLSKKVLIADILAKTVDTIYGMLYSGMDVGTAWIGTILFTLQIYFDFSGYSDMAIGLAKIFGFDFAENFNFSYRSKSITEFWRRWHISLGAWFREYLYFPLGGNRKGMYMSTCLLSLW